MKRLSKSFYVQKRKQLAETLSPDGMLILAGNSELERTKDVSYPFRQSNNFVYLTGVDQPDAYLVLTQDSETLYIKQLHPFMAVWEGRSNQIDDLKKISGIEDIREYKKVEELFTDLPQMMYLDMPDDKSAQIAAWHLWQQVKDSYPDVELAAINPVIEAMRVIKSDQESDLIEEAIQITDQLLQHTRPLLKPGVTERAIAAEFIRAASEQGIEQSFPPIISFGKNTCVIHHTPDDTKLVEGDLVLFDVGLEVGGYASDISRMVQVGQMSDRQKEVLRAVRSVQADAIKLMKPGITFNEFEQQAAEIMIHKLVEIGLFASVEEAMQLEGDLEWPAYRRYFNHFTSHYLGLDAHDVGSREVVLEPGMVLTCEPGIYIAEEGIGVRVEDDVLITAQGNRVLSQELELQ